MLSGSSAWLRNAEYWFLPVKSTCALPSCSLTHVPARLLTILQVSFTVLLDNYIDASAQIAVREELNRAEDRLAGGGGGGGSSLQATCAGSLLMRPP